MTSKTFRPASFPAALSVEFETGRMTGALTALIEIEGYTVSRLAYWEGEEDLEETALAIYYDEARLEAEALAEAFLAEALLAFDGGDLEEALRLTGRGMISAEAALRGDLEEEFFNLEGEISEAEEEAAAAYLLA